MVGSPTSKRVISPEHYISDFEKQYTKEKPVFCLSVDISHDTELSLRK